MLTILRTVVFSALLAATGIAHSQTLQFQGPSTVTSGQISGGIVTNTSGQIANVYSYVTDTLGASPITWNVLWNADGTASIIPGNSLSSQITWKLSLDGNFEVFDMKGEAGSTLQTSFTTELVMNGKGIATVLVDYTIPVTTTAGLVSSSGKIPIAVVKQNAPGVYYSPNKSDSVPYIWVSDNGSSPSGGNATGGQWVTVTYDQTTWSQRDDGSMVLDISTVSVMVWVQNSTGEDRNRSYA